MRVLDFFHDAKVWDTREANAPDSFCAGCIRLGNIKTMQMAFSGIAYPQHTLTAYLFGKEEGGAFEGPQVFLHAFRLPEGEAEFQREMRCYEADRRAFKLERGHQFHDGFLTPRHVMPDFNHQAFQVRDGPTRRRIVHVYRAEGEAAIVVFSLNSARFASNSFFAKVCNNLKITHDHAA